MFKSQMNWIVNNRISENIVFVEGLGDCVQNADVHNEWKRVDTCMKIIENPVTTSLVHGIPYGINVGNHDQLPDGTPGATPLFNTYFGFNRFAGRTYYGGHYGSTNNNNYCLFTAGGIDFIVINLEFNVTMPAAVITWMKDLLTTHSNRRAIIGSHTMISAAGQFGAQGQTIYNNVKDFSNVFLMLCGHIIEEARRTDSLNGNVIHTLLSDYQGRTNGGNGWMRIMKFSPANNTISVKTFSPWLNQYETDANSQFTINFDLQPTRFINIGTVSSVNSGTIYSQPWNNLSPNTCYEWFATIHDGTNAITTPKWKFTTAASTQAAAINLKVFIEALYKSSGTMISVSNPSVCDTIIFELHNTVAPYVIEESKKVAINTTGNCTMTFPSTVFGKPFYLTVKHRSSLETWSAVPVLLNASTTSYDFTNAINKAYNNNLKNLNDGRFAIYSGDVDQDGTIDEEDYSLVENASQFFLAGYYVFDVTGDGITESADYCFLENYFLNNVVVARP